MKTLISVLLLSATLSTSVFANVAIVVNKTMAEAITKDDISRMYTGRSSALQPVNLPDSNTVRNIFDEKAMGRSSSQLKAYWSKLVFTGKGTPPPELANEQAVLEHVSANEYAVGYVSKDSVNDSVKVLMIIE
jgi:ABC-type phosphate transport system substrate-binding protein